MILAIAFEKRFVNARMTTMDCRHPPCMISATNSIGVTGRFYGPCKRRR